MINYKELRTGNWVMTDNAGHTLPQWHKIMPEDIFRIANGEVENLGISIDPIPITESILLKAGFIQSTIYNMVVYEYVKEISPNQMLCLNQETGTASIKGHAKINNIKECIGIKLLIKLKYVHQLQNLYFTLTGEELAINLEKEG